MYEVIQVIALAVLFLFLLLISYTIGRIKGELDSYREGIEFGFLIAMDGAEPIIDNDDL